MNIYLNPDDELYQSIKEWCKNNPMTENLRCFNKDIKISSPMKGQKHTEETKKILSLLNSGENNKFYGKKHTAETKRLIGSKSIGRVPSSENLKKRSISCSISKRKEWILLSPNGNEYYTNNLKEFCKQNSLNYGNICSVSRGERKHNKGWTIKPRLYNAQENS
jgi:hypothetical protein